MSDSSGSTMRDETGEGTRLQPDSDRSVDARDGDDYDSMPDFGQPEDLDDGGADYASLVDHGGGDLEDPLATSEDSSQQEDRLGQDDRGTVEGQGPPPSGDMAGPARTDAPAAQSPSTGATSEIDGVVGSDVPAAPATDTDRPADDLPEPPADGGVPPETTGQSQSADLTVATVVTDGSDVTGSGSEVSGVTGNRLEVSGVTGNRLEVSGVTGNRLEVSGVTGNRLEVSGVTGNRLEVSGVTGNGSDVTEVTGNGSDVTEVTGNGSRVTDESDVTDVGSHVTDVSGRSDVAVVTDLTDGSNVTEVGARSDVTDVTDVTDVSNVTGGPDVSVVTGRPDVSVVTDGPDVSGVADGPDVSDVSGVADGSAGADGSTAGAEVSSDSRPSASDVPTSAELEQYPAANAPDPTASELATESETGLASPGPDKAIGSDSDDAVAGAQEWDHQQVVDSAKSQLVAMRAAGDTFTGSPVERADQWNWQGENDFGFKSTCGLASVADIGTSMGAALTENDVVNTAIDNKLCETTPEIDEFGNLDFSDCGRTTASNRADLLTELGINNTIEYVNTPEELASLLTDQHGVIAFVNAGELWGADENASYEEQVEYSADITSGPVPDHAVVVTSAVTSPSGELKGFVINDHGDPYGAGRFVDLGRWNDCWTFVSGSSVTNVPLD